MQDSPLNIIIKNYYKEMLRYCNMKLRNHHAAEDCTQEIFLLFVKKSGTIDFSKDIRPWLYAAADRIMKNYLRKNPPMEDVDTVPEPTEEFQYSESFLDELEAEERNFLLAYYNADDRKQLAKEMGVSLPALHMRFKRLKEKIKKEFGKK